MAHILITNDDGIQAEGLRALVHAVEGLGTISVVAPSHERSAAAQSLTLRHPIFWDQIAAREWSVEGTPADCVILALNKLLPNRPDIVISGVNRGGNMGENIFYSGTVGAAMEAAINHIPAIAVSVAHKGRAFRFEHAAKLARDLAQMALTEGMPHETVLNVNVPLAWNGNVRITRQSKKVTRNVLQEGTDPRGRGYFWLLEQEHIEGLDPQSDYAAVFDGAASITPLHLDRTHEVSLNHLSQWATKLESNAEEVEPATVTRNVMK
ncbi:MAG TPA: 5'/3'-nucleotidase SurE [Candidatus Saccharimonadales bacterium]|jgi:5'-nucleotidase|nr:5'/3'-nucleotidase SurE [Candidatus Saccharimonadales bacterium]